jgi:nitrate reductase gamma subunit
MTTLGKILMVAAYCVYASFWMRFFAHVLVWWRAARRLSASAPAPVSRSRIKACALTAADVFLFGRLLVVNPALWLGEWVFHVSLLLVLLRHLRYFLDPVPAWVWSIQFAGAIAGYVLLLSLVYILVVRLFTAMEKYASRANMFLLGLVLVISSIGVVMHAWLTPNLLDVKFFVRGFLCFNPAPAPGSLLFMAHFILVLVLVPFLPTHIFTAPLVMIEARRREQALHLVMHEK